MKNLILIISAFILSACAHHSKPKLPDKPYMKDKVSVNTVLMQAHAAYVRGCLEAYQEIKPKERGFKFCKKKADSYLEKDVISILEQ